MNQENHKIQEEPHKRRVRYKGKYPKNFKEKYIIIYWIGDKNGK